MVDDEELTLREHLRELRRRVIYSAIAVAITCGISFYFADRVFDVLEELAPEDTHFIFTEPVELMLIYFKISVYGGVALALPFLVYQAVMFVRPALTGREKTWLYLLLPAVAVFFAIGGTFGYYFVPRMLEFLINFPLAEDVADPEIKISSYVSFVVRLLFGLGLAFETPLVIFFLAKIGVVTPGWLIRKWQYAVVIAFVAAAAITPTPDPINCTIVAVALIALYLVGVFLAVFAVRGAKKDEDISGMPEGG